MRTETNPYKPGHSSPKRGYAHGIVKGEHITEYIDVEEQRASNFITFAGAGSGTEKKNDNV